MNPPEGIDLDFFPLLIKALGREAERPVGRQRRLLVLMVGLCVIVVLSWPLWRGELHNF